jgi:hypothetical protein
MKRIVNLVAALALLVTGIFIGLTIRSAPAAAQSGCQTFRETGKNVCGRFLEYWQQNGGLAQQGLPLSNEFTEVSDLNGKPYTVQYFERAVFEKHPENARPYDVLLSQLGTFQFQRKYPGGDPSAGGQPQPPAPQPPPGSIIGQTFTYTPFVGKTTFKAEVVDAKETTTIPKTDFWDEQKAQGKYVAVLMKVENTGNEPGTFFSGDFRLKDGRGRSFDTSSNISAVIAAGAYYKVKNPGDSVQPGFSDTFVLLFDVPTDVAGYTLIRH